jgi:hypothetical protein
MVTPVAKAPSAVRKARLSIGTFMQVSDETLSF